MTPLDWLFRATLFAAGLLLPALVLARLLLSRQPGLRHAWLLGALLLAAAGPLWLLAGSQFAVPPTVAADAVGVPEAPGSSWLPGPAGGALAAVRAGEQNWIPAVIFAIWAAGAGLALGRVARACGRIGRMRRRAHRLPGLPGVLVSAEVPAAVVVGLLRPTVVLAPDVASDPQLLAEVLAHERAHVRRRDPVWGLLQRLAGALYWFHPLVYLVSREISRAREEACDDQVLAGHPATGYARTLLSLATRGPLGWDAPGVLSAAGELERRIRRLLERRPPGRWRLALAAALLSSAALVLGGARLALALAPAAGAPALRGSVSERAASPAEQAFLALAGPQASATFVLRELDTGDTVIINPALARQRVTPASTFKLVVALVALETGVVSDQSFALPWDGRAGGMPGWDRDHTLKSAMSTSANWYFQELLRRIDRRPLEAMLGQLGYGTQQLGADATQAYMNGDLAISPLEQVEALARLAGGEVPMRPATRQVMDQITHLGRVGDADIHGKTGTATGPATGTVAWLVGHVRRGPRRVVFATLLRAPATEVDRLRNQRLPITRGLLTSLGILPVVAP